MTQEEFDIQQEIERNGEARFYPTSSSMCPTINPRRDICIIGPLPKKYLRRGTVVLYRRSDGFMTVNRVIHHGRRTHAYRLCGDNRMHQERGITRTQMIGVVTAIESRKSGFRLRSKGLPLRLWTVLMLIRTWLAVHWYSWIQSPAVSTWREVSAPFRELRLNRHHRHNHSDSKEHTEGHHHHHHHHHSMLRGAKNRHPYQVGRGAFGDLIHALKKSIPKKNATRAPSREEQNIHEPKGSGWKRFFGIKAERVSKHDGKMHAEGGGHHHYHHHHHSSYDYGKDRWLTRTRGEFFFLGLRLPWVPKFILKKYGYKSTKKVNNNLLTTLDWTIPTNEFHMPYNLPMQTLSYIVFVILIVKMLMAISWLVYFLLYGNENSSRIYMYNLLITATWFPIAVFFIAYYYHLNKIIFMSIKHVSLMAACASLLRVLIFIYKVIGSFRINLVTVFNMMEVVCWLCIAGFFFIMHYKLSEREDFIPRFWLTKAQKQKRRERIKAKARARHEKRREEISREYDHRQSAHIEH